MRKSFKDLSDLPIRLAVGFHLMYGTLDNIASWERMLEFRDFLEAFRFPMPLLFAVVSVYLQFFSGVLFLIGWQVRLAGLVMAVNFVIAILMVHLNDPYPAVYPAISMLAGSVFMMLNGEGKWSLSYWMAQKKATK